MLQCEAPLTLKTTWALGPSMTTELELRFTPEGGNTILELEHSTPAAIFDEMVAAYGPGGTIGVAVGWDLTLNMLGKYLAGEYFDPAAWENSEDAKEYAKSASSAWARLFRRRVARAMKTSLPLLPSRTHISPRRNLKTDSCGLIRAA